VVEAVVGVMGLNLATAAMLAQDASTQDFLRALYDQAAQLLTLSTATAAIFVGLSDKNTFRGLRQYLRLVVPLVISAVCAVLMMSSITNLMGASRNYSNSSLEIGGSLFGLRVLHGVSLVALAVGVLMFIFIKLSSAPADTDTAETKRIKLVDDQGKVHIIVSVSHEEQVRAARSEHVPWWWRMFGG
jgi:hypothetical protein